VQQKPSPLTVRWHVMLDPRAEKGVYIQQKPLLSLSSPYLPQVAKHTPTSPSLSTPTITPYHSLSSLLILTSRSETSNGSSALHMITHTPYHISYHVMSHLSFLSSRSTSTLQATETKQQTQGEENEQLYISLGKILGLWRRVQER
jgi:hypothetical protein